MRFVVVGSRTGNIFNCTFLLIPICRRLRPSDYFAILSSPYLFDFYVANDHHLVALFPQHFQYTTIREAFSTSTNKFFN